MAKTIRPEALWFIAYTMTNGCTGLYAGGGYRTRTSAIGDHEKACGRPWKELKRGGDYAVKCLVTPLAGARTGESNEA